MRDIKRGSAVSPVIGTILLVAITVVLVAIIGAVMMSLADAEDGKKVGMNAQPDNIETAKAKLILYGGESISELIKLEMIDHDSPYGKYVELWNGTAGSVNVGVPYTTLEDVAQPPEDMAVYDTRINVKGTFTDGREVILLVQPMTFYDVNRSANSYVTPLVNPPSVTDITYTTAQITVTYENMSIEPTEYRIYYQPVDESSDEKMILVTGPDTLFGTFAHKLENLDEGVEYYVWGSVITSIDGTVNSTKVTFAPLKFNLKDFNVTVQSSSVISAEFYYENAPSDFSARGLYYQLVEGGPEEYISIGGWGTPKYGYATGSITGLDEGTEYYVWGSVTTTEGVKNTSKVKARTLGYALRDFKVTVQSSSSIAVEFYHDNAPSALSARGFYYQPVDGGPEKYVSASGWGTPKYGYTSATIKGLDDDTEYLIWGSLTTSAGVRNTSKVKARTLGYALKDFKVTGSSSSSIVVEFYFENAPSDISARGFYYQPVGGGPEKYVSASGWGTPKYGYASATIKGLDDDTEYLIWGSLKTSAGVKNTSKISDKTLDYSIYYQSSSITSSSAYISFDYRNLPVSTYISRGFYYRVAGDEAETYVSADSGWGAQASGRFWVTLKDLESKKPYEVKASITTSLGTQNSSVYSFTTS